MKDTLKSPPPEKQTMKKASTIASVVTTLFYLSCGGFGYAAFGDDTPGNLLTGFGFYEPYWLIDFANACIVLHLLGGYQVTILYAKFIILKSSSSCWHLKSLLDLCYVSLSGQDYGSYFFTIRSSAKCSTGLYI